MAANTASEMREVIHVLFPEKLGFGAKHNELEATRRKYDELEYCPVEAPNSGYLQSLNNEGLLGLAEENDLVISLPVAPGDFIIKGSVLLRLSPPDRHSDELASRLASMFILGKHRTVIQDAKYPLQQLTVIAVRALSPGINDPFTAITCIDWIGSGLLQLAQREIPSPYRKGRDGKYGSSPNPPLSPSWLTLPLTPFASRARDTLP